MVGRGDLTERAWTAIEPLLSVSGRRGGQLGNGEITARSSMGFCGNCGPGCPGGICPSGMDRGRRAQIGSIAGDARGCGIVS